MNDQTTRNSSQRQHVPFFLPYKELNICPSAEPFAAVCEMVLQEVSGNPTDVTVNLALLTLQFKFFSCFEQVPAACRKHMNSSKVRCILQLYYETYLKIWAVDVKLRPPRFREPPPPPPPPTKVTKVYKIDKFAFPIGEVEADEE